MKAKQQRRRQEKGFSNELSETSNSNPRGREDDGVRGTSEQLNNQENPKVAGLLKYCIKHNHWSVFEQAYMTLRLKLLAESSFKFGSHRSFTYQEFSQRYADSSMLAEEIPLFDLRSQDTKNRQNSIDDVDPFTKQELEIVIAVTLKVVWTSTDRC